jgi:hypothetical protein
MARVRAGRKPLFERLRAAAYVRLLALGLVLPVLLGAHLPWLARVIAGPAAHVCRCDAHHTDCACPICFPDREDLKKNELAVRAPCGDADEAFGTVAFPAVLAAPVVVVPRAPVAFAVPVFAVPSIAHGPSPPDPPPPRA